MSSRTVRDRIASLLNDSATADVTFVVSEQQVRFPAHSAVMSTASDPFREMFFGAFNRERVVEIPDTSSEAFQVLLQLIYTDEADLTDDNLASILSLADKYLVKELFDRCVQHVTAANVCRFLPLAELYGDLTQHCWRIALENGDEVLKSVYFLDLPKDLLVRILDSDGLRADEKTVFNRAIDWARRRLDEEGLECEPSSVRSTLGYALHLIRFPLFDVTDFADGPLASGILTDMECFSLLLWFSTRKGHVLFSTKARRGTVAAANVGRFGYYLEAQDFNLCAKCSATRVQKEGEQHPSMENVSSLVEVDSSQSADANTTLHEKAQRCIQALEHSCQCRDANCRTPTCHKWKKVLQHIRLCKQRRQAPGSCLMCKHLITLCRYHAKHCDLSACPVPLCSKHQEQKRLLGLLREKCEAARASCGHAGVQWICWDCYEPCCEVPECECSISAHKDRTKHAISFNGSSAFCSQCRLPIASE